MRDQESLWRDARGVEVPLESELGRKAARGMFSATGIVVGGLLGPASWLMIRRWAGRQGPSRERDQGRALYYHREQSREKDSF